MSSRSCPNCGGSEIDVDHSRGVSCCTSCGLVIENSIIVNEVQFEENAHGGSQLIGQSVSLDGRFSGRRMPGGLCYGGSRESRQITLDNGRRRITELAQQLRLNQSNIDEACNFYKMAVRAQLTRGRRQPNVAASCLYMSCRLQGTPHVLLDFSNVLQVNVYELGKCYFTLSSRLYIKIPASDPCIYIIRYAHLLKFGDKTTAVIETATRLVSRMKKDWIHFGRRPSGLCGAALLVAARLHEFNRTINDIIKVVNVCKATLRKRLNEFGETPSSRLTLSEFMTIDLEEEQDPPAFKSSRKKATRQQLDENSLDEAATAKEVSELQKKIEQRLDEKKRKLRGIYSDAVGKDTEKFIGGESSDAVDFLRQDAMERICNLFIKDGEENENSLANEWPSWKLEELRPTADSLGLNNVTKYQHHQPPMNTEDENGILDLSGIDDDEIDTYIMKPYEVNGKMTLWHTINAAYVEELKDKEEREARLAEEGITKPEKKKRKSRKSLGLPAASAGEAIEKMLQERKISTKINYEILSQIDPSFCVPSSVEVNNTRTPMKLSEDKIKEPENKKMKVDSNTTVIVAKPVETTASVNDSLIEHKLTLTSVIETGPVYNENEVDPDGADEEEEEDDEHATKMSKLFESTKHVEADDDYYGDDVDEYYDD
ncbi:hypothetical protein CHUAL_014273 [Chamberlinius hualienensis]